MKLSRRKFECKDNSAIKRHRTDNIFISGRQIRRNAAAVRGARRVAYHQGRPVTGHVAARICVKICGPYSLRRARRENLLIISRWSVVRNKKVKQRGATIYIYFYFYTYIYKKKTFFGRRAFISKVVALRGANGLI